ncbi:MAG: cytochrome c biogenesis protein CcsA [Planctomycetota bacterium]
MATEISPTSIGTRSGTSLSFNDIVQALVMPLASLRLTVALLAMALLVTFIATLEQNWADVYDVKMRHFSSLFVSVPFQVFFVPAWFPEMQNVPGRFFMPSGMAVLGLMLINLTAAHIMRFKLQAKGTRLIFGIISALFAILVTWAVIFNGQNSDGFQAAPPISYERMWLLMQVGLLSISIASVMGFVFTRSGQKIERLLLFLGAFVSAAVLGVTVYYGESAFIGDSAMRVMWQLIQATMAAMVSYVACALLFNRKAGMVLLHLGVAGLMVNEIFVTVTNNEQRITVYENQTVSHAIDIRSTEMAVINVSDDEFDEVVAVPSSRLKSQQEISSSDLPFDITCLQYLPASNVRRAMPNSDNLANTGFGLIGQAYPVPPVAGTDAEQVVDFASAYVELKDKQTGESLGQHLISQYPGVRRDSVTVDGTNYFIELRFETEYKPYSITLTDATREDYPGTKTPKYYGSDILLDDFETGKVSPRRIYMNNPLRYSDETFYQSGMDTDLTGRELSIFQVVTNVGWMIPYVCCMFTVVGLVAQFGTSLLAYLNKKQKQSSTNGGSGSGDDASPTVPVAELADPVVGVKPNRVSITAWIPALVLVLVFGGWGWSLSMSANRPVEKDKMRLDLLAQLPITYEGRVQPLGSYAINTARQLRERESLDDGENEKQAAIRWVADVAFGAKGALEYRAFYVTDMNIIDALKLPKGFSTDRDRKNYVYTLDELMKSRDKLEELIPNPDVKDPKTWSTFQLRLAKLRTKIQKVLGMRLMFGTDVPENASAMQTIEEFDYALKTLVYTPYMVPVEETDNTWISKIEFDSRAWIGEFAERFGVETIDELAETVFVEEIAQQLRSDMIRDRIVERFMMVPEFVKLQEKRYGETDVKLLADLTKRDWDKLPKEARDDFESREALMVDAILQQQRPAMIGALAKNMRKLNGGRDELGINSVPVDTIALLNQLQPAYLEGDAETFNKTLESHLASMSQAKPFGYSENKLATERRYNHSTPFYVSSAIYLAAVLFAALSWLGFYVRWLHVAMSRAALALLLVGLLFHANGIIMRVIISGRPPVTNLYSSVIFVGMASVGLLIICELATRLSIASALAGLGGFGSLIWAHSMTVVDGDTFTVMQAVLDTTFWLATHVVCISIGYAATFVAGLLGIAYVVGGMVTTAFQDKKVKRLFINILYGVVCFGLLTSFFGTVLGGLWGDDSWGRFWGWDPKENGALMIVLCNALILHARWGGLVKERGIAVLAILGNIVVLWSWKGVNAMGVGLHAYGATEDKALQAIVLCGAAHLLLAAVALTPTRFWLSNVAAEAKT